MNDSYRWPAWLLVAVAQAATAADVTVQPAPGSGFVVKDAAGTNERLRVNEDGSVRIPAANAGTQQSTPVCSGAGGLLGPCSGGGTGGGGAVLPPGTTNQTLRYDGGNALAATDDLKVFADGGVLATNAAVNAALANGQTPTGTVPASGPGARLMWYPAKAAFRAGYAYYAEWDDAQIGLHSTAMGYATKASGNYSAAMGNSTTASGFESTAMGSITTASGGSSTAMGYAATASGNYSTAMGSRTRASGDTSTAMGFDTTASGDYSTAMGRGTTAGSCIAPADHPEECPAGSGSYQTAMGHLTTASGDTSTAMGSGTKASGAVSTAMGTNSVASGQGSTAMGANGDTNNHAFSFVYSDSGITQNDADDQFMVRASGGFKFYTDSGSAGVQLAPGAGAWTSLSDRNAKDAVQPVDARAVLAKVVAMPLATWHYKTQETKYRHMGPMAQDFHAAFHLGESETGIDTIDADGVALAAIQGLNAELKERLAAQQRQLAAKDAQIEALRTDFVAQQARVAALESVAGDLAALKREVAETRTQLQTLQAHSHDRSVLAVYPRRRHDGAFVATAQP